MTRTYQRFTLADNRRDQVHAVSGARTLCGVSLAFAPHPLETDLPVTCPTCLRKLPVQQAMTYGRFPLDDESAAALLGLVRKYGALLRRGAHEAAARAYMEIVTLAYGDYARIESTRAATKPDHTSASGEPSPTSVEPLARGTAESGGAGAPAGAEGLIA